MNSIMYNQSPNINRDRKSCQEIPDKICRCHLWKPPACGEERDGGAHHDEDAGHVEEVGGGRAEVEGDRVVHDVHVLGKSKADYSFLS